MGLSDWIRSYLSSSVQIVNHCTKLEHEAYCILGKTIIEAAIGRAMATNKFDLNIAKTPQVIKGIEKGVSLLEEVYEIMRLHEDVFKKQEGDVNYEYKMDMLESTICNLNTCIGHA